VLHGKVRGTNRAKIDENMWKDENLGAKEETRKVCIMMFGEMDTSNQIN
jgi:hypothetical protein